MAAGEVVRCRPEVSRCFKSHTTDESASSRSGGIYSHRLRARQCEGCLRGQRVVPGQIRKPKEVTVVTRRNGVVGPGGVPIPTGLAMLTQFANSVRGRTAGEAIGAHLMVRETVLLPAGF